MPGQRRADHSAGGTTEEAVHRPVGVGAYQAAGRGHDVQVRGVGAQTPLYRVQVVADHRSEVGVDGAGLGTAQQSLEWAENARPRHVLETGLDEHFLDLFLVHRIAVTVEQRDAGTGDASVP